MSSPGRPPVRSRPGRRGRSGAITASALLALVVAVAAARFATRPAPARTADGTLTVATWNMCGVRQWNCSATGGAAAKNTALRRLVTADGARVLLLQEACSGDLEAARRSLGRSWRLAFQPYSLRDRTGRTTAVRCTGDGRGTAGFAVLSAHPLTAVRVVPSPQPVAGLRRGILCATVAVLDVRVCAAHLTLPGGDAAHPNWEYRDDQLKALVAAVPERRTVFGGDFNLAPPDGHDPAAWVWPGAAFHVYRECDQDASSRPRNTHASGHKLDYLFTALPRVSCAVRETGVSDHRALLLKVRTG
ncbi:endonuclease/exonuclease/phosphatase family protein [Streptomyces sp. SID5914]|nr:endonuclease/exonuclease/phosphatase family protein [Streptomyces sp. SID5914]MZG20037.1 endonuclease/exonuclease/phosphatase family protein [Streptomyces sp. SID5914]